MANKSIKISISTALSAVGITAAKRALTSLASHTKDFAKAVGSNLMNIKAGFDLISEGARKFLSVMSKGMEFERMTTTFKSLTGSMELAKLHMKDLQDLGRTPPFSLEAFAAASQMMMKMTGGMLGYRKEMELVGDIAAATGNDISQVGRAVGLAYQIIRDGQPFGRAGSQLVQLGILTKKQVTDFDDMTKAGKSNVEIWSKLQSVLSKYNGAMADTEKTAKGMVEAIQGEATVAVTTFSQAVTDTAKPALEGLLGWMRRINEDGTIELWADRTVEFLKRVSDETKILIGWLGTIPNMFYKIRDGLERVGASVGAYVGALAGGGSLEDAKNAGVESLTMIKREQSARVIDSINAEIKAEEEARLRAEERIRKAKEESAKADAERQKRIAEDMAQAKIEIEKRAAKEAAEKEKKEWEDSIKKRQQDWDDAQSFINATMEDAAREDEKRQKKLADAEKKAVKEAHDAKIKALDEEEKKTQKMIDRLLARGADNPLARAGGGNWQANDEREARQKKINDDRMKAEQDKLEKRARAKFGDDWLKELEKPENRKKLGRLNNLQAAALEKMQLDANKNKVADIEKQRQKAIDDMNKTLDDISKKLDSVGL